ncbi:MAG: AmmeMemoRadiSam system protein B [Acidobacteria bacterium]|nr:AmmeMemoRadiSam system protein B [Acidobacteriota bacterium]
MKSLAFVLMFTGALIGASVVSAQGPTRAQVEKIMGLRSEGDLVRGQMDAVGFVVTADQAEDVLTHAIKAESAALVRDRARLHLAPGEGVPAVVCPHDDHLYAARVYVHATQLIRAPRVIMIGVFHKARLWNLSDRLVFDRFEAWHGPWGPVRVDPLRHELLAGMPAEDVVVSDTMHCREHSLEAIVPFLEYGNRNVRIVPILVPYMGWNRMAQLADHLSSVLAKTMKKHHWQFGKDVAIVISTDLVHYGPDFDYAPFGTDLTAYEQAVAQDHRLIRDHLEGPLSAHRLHTLLDQLVDPADPHVYTIPWCGRFSVPFGLEMFRQTARKLHLADPTGTLLRYGTSLSEPELPVSKQTREEGLGYTAPSNFHHWVGYGAIAYVIPSKGAGGR